MHFILRKTFIVQFSQIAYLNRKKSIDFICIIYKKINLLSLKVNISCNLQVR